MTTEDVVENISPGQKYSIRANYLLETEKEITTNSQRVATPRFIEIQAVWKKESDGENVEGNVLGEYGELEMATEEISIPSAVTDQEHLNYYGCKLYTVGDVFSFETDKVLPLTIMDVGENYVEDYVMKEVGIYLEYHDRPHFHMPVNEDSRGHLMLGKKISKDKYHLSAFTIPYGKAVYMPPYTIHNDCFLIGRYMVVYSMTKDYSTVILKNNNKNVHVKVD